MRVNQSRWNPEPLESAEKGPGDRFWRPEQNLESFAGVAGRSEIEFSSAVCPRGREVLVLADRLRTRAKIMSSDVTCGLTVVEVV